MAINSSAVPTLLLVLSLVLSNAAAKHKFLSVDANDGASQDDTICKTMVETQGYACEEHRVTTKDGYILSMQRIPARGSAKPVLLQHGLFMDAQSWLLNPPSQALPFILADHGFDVWLSNTRGTNYSRQHTSLTPNDPAYWEWSWDQLVAYDLTASVQYVHDHTGQKLHYVGHSLGTLIALAALSQRMLLDKLISAALLSPIAYLDQVSSTLTKSAADSFLAEDLYWLGLHEFAPRGEAVTELLEDLCSKPGINCSNLMNSFTGPNCCVNSSQTDTFLEHEPQSTATKNMIHLAQMIRTGTIEMYDYGNEVDNMGHYGQATPPVYNLTTIPKDFPLLLSYGGKDMLSDVNDVKNLLDNLKDHESDKLVVKYIEQYAHADFVYGVNANQLVYGPLMAFFKQT